MKRPRQCSFCGEVQKYKLTTVYARWYPMGSASQGFQIRLCDECFVSLLTPAIVSTFSMKDDDTFCPMCKDPDIDDLLWTYLHVYPRAQEEQVFEVPLCEPCVRDFRQPLIDYGVKLEDRAPAKTDEPVDAWASIGIHPVAAS